MSSVMLEFCVSEIEAVFERVEPHRDGAGLAYVTLRNEKGGLRLDVAWSVDTPPRLYR